MLEDVGGLYDSRNVRLRVEHLSCVTDVLDPRMFTASATPAAAAVLSLRAWQLDRS